MALAGFSVTRKQTAHKIAFLLGLGLKRGPYGYKQIPLTDTNTNHNRRKNNLS